MRSFLPREAASSSMRTVSTGQRPALRAAHTRSAESDCATKVCTSRLQLPVAELDETKNTVGSSPMRSSAHSSPWSMRATFPSTYSERCVASVETTPGAPPDSPLMPERKGSDGCP